MSPDLSRRLAKAMGTKYVSLDEQRTIRRGVVGAEDWPDLPSSVQMLVEQIEARPNIWS